MQQQFLLGRQPIFDNDFNVDSYELLFRGDFSTTDGDQKTAQVIVNALMEVGVEKLSAGKHIHINASEKFLLDDIGLAFALPADKVGIEVLEDVPVTPEVIAAVRALKEQGFTILLDDVIFKPHLKPLIELADIIKVDVMFVDDLTADVHELRKYPVKLLAEKVEDHAMFERCRALNFDLYQGYFFSRPDIVEGKKAPDSKVSILRALQKVMTANAVSDLQDIIKQDISLSFRLLKYINSAAFGMRREIQSIEQALVLLGLANVRRWLSLLSLATLGDDKPSELIRISLHRGRLLESIARNNRTAAPEDSFLVGMFSVIDALLDKPMKEVLSEINLAPNIQEGLLDPSSVLGIKLALAYMIEQGAWDQLSATIEQHQIIHIDTLIRLNTEAMAWADEQMAELQ